MRVLLVGGGGREHALAWALTKSPHLGALVVSEPNPGFPSDAPVVDAWEAWALAERPDLVVIGPEQPLAEGASDRLRAAGLSVAAPSRAAARIETSKSWAKAFMDRHGIPTAAWSVHDDEASALAANPGPCVVKADGLALGKGVTVAQTADEARAAIGEAFAGRFGHAGQRVVIEELLRGPEVSLLAWCDGARVVPLLTARDHKRRFDGDQGPNTGGMGVVAPLLELDAAWTEDVVARVLAPVVAGMAAEGHPYQGVLYAGLMQTAKGVRVIEFNARFGDPECQPLMALLDDDLLPWMHGMAVGRLPEARPRWRAQCACAVVLVAEAYPGPTPKGMPIHGDLAERPDSVVFIAGARKDADGQLAVTGGRVLTVVGRGPTAPAAREAAYARAHEIEFATKAMRMDIGATAQV